MHEWGPFLWAAVAWVIGLGAGIALGYEISKPAANWRPPVVPDLLRELRRQRKQNLSVSRRLHLDPTGWRVGEAQRRYRRCPSCGREDFSRRKGARLPDPR